MPAENDRMCIIENIDGFTPSIGSLICMMKYIRKGTIHAVNGLTREMLDHLHDEKSNSIGMLLFHMAATEKWYQNDTFKGEKVFSGEESDFWNKGSLELRESALTIKGNDLDYYLNLLDRVREETYSEFKNRDDNWLKNEINDEWGLTNNWFKWFHVFEDEINHRGQISWLRKRLPSAG